MFVYLNACPSFHVRLFWNAIYGPKSRIALLASNILKKKGSDDFEIKAKKIIGNIFQVLGFKHIFYDYEGTFGTQIEAIKNINVTDKKLLQRVGNHPVHILNDEGEFSPTSFIPFCSFGEDFMGTKVDEFDLPVCNIFKPKLQHDQLCYETDLQDLRNNDSNILEKQLEMGLTLVLDYNEERQNSHHSDSVSMYLDTISIELKKIFHFDILNFT